MNRRLRLALLLAALAAGGPLAAAPQAFHAPRAQVSIAWFQVNPASRPQKLHARQAIHPPVAERCVCSAQPDRVLRDTLRVHSLFQRPPPLHS